MDLELDHVLIAAHGETWHGLASIAGGRHPGWGTANRLVPLGESYLELVTVVDEAEAARSVFGRWVAGARSGAPFGWAVRTDDLDAVAARLGLTVRDGARQAPDGRRLTWRMAGIEQAAAEPSLPFFIEWGPETPFPGASAYSARPRRTASLSLNPLHGAFGFRWMLSTRRSARCGAPTSCCAPHDRGMRLRLFGRIGSAENATVVSIGSTTPAQRELPAELIARAALVVVDGVEEVLHGSGDMITARAAGIDVEARTASLNSVLLGERSVDLERGIRIYKSTGAGLQDIVVAEALVDLARERGIGTELPVGIVTTRK